LRRKLERDLNRVHDEPMIGLIGAVSVMLGGHSGPLGLVPDFPAEGVGATLPSRYYIPPWTLETLVNELLATPKARGFEGGGTRIVRHDRFEVLKMISEMVIALENKEDGLYLEGHDIFTEMGRIAQRQFPWQRGLATAPILYRSMLLFGTGAAASEFQRVAGLPVDAFAKVGAWLAGALQRRDWERRDTDLAEVGITPAQREAALVRLSIPLATARAKARKMRAGRRHTAYRPSILRDHPIIAFGEGGARLRSPIPELITPRFTSGLYMDVIGGGGAVWTEIGERFERYCRDYLVEMMPTHDIEGEFDYGPKKARSRSPDVLVSQNNEIVMVGECKAKRMSFEARFADEPYDSAEGGYDELAKGVFQIWRFASHVRRGLVPGRRLADGWLASVITVDPWLSMARNEERRVIERANAMADEIGGIDAVDRRPVPVSPIEDIEYVLQHGDAETLLDAIRAVSGGEKQGWILSMAHAARIDEERPYPFMDRIAEILPWWRTALPVNASHR